MATRILVVEDEPSIQELLVYALTQAGYEVERANDAAQARAAVLQRLPELVVLDWMMPGESGVALARAWRSDKRTRDLPIIMLTAKGEEQDKVSGLEAGADDYLTKPFSPRELMARVQALLRRRAPEHAQEKLSAGELTLDPVRHQVAYAGVEVVLGPTEYKLLQVLLAHQERVFSRVQLLDQVWGDHVYIEDRTVDVHILRLRKVLQPFGMDAWVQTVRGAGYRLAAPSVS